MVQFFGNIWRDWVIGLLTRLLVDYVTVDLYNMYPSLIRTSFII